MNSPNVDEPVKKGYFASRWNGHVARGTLFWWDMVIVGTLVNMVAGLVSLILLAKGVHGGIWLVFHLVLVLLVKIPYLSRGHNYIGRNLFLTLLI